ncbi:hypothetical protein GCM10022251_79580 [Phytohabitans flavus]|uniref:ABM domain-containing protein n=1 Tax=Phytohabitans flavus TaxID=1076124 RepID=A0A6F8Y472_9ACTN|nr:hypothetical protein [Phytohabitans flavus]BCB80912.1 hypothetical protein Pflav_073220 [Phytohabitans flavus]
MYARLQTTRDVLNGPDTEALRAQVTEMISGHPGFAGLFLLEQLGIGWGAMVTLWQTRQDAVLASERSAARGPRPITLHSDDIYEVEEDWPGLAAGERPEAATLLYFDGPLSAARIEAARFASRERILPATRDLPGRVRTLVLFDPEEAKSAVVTLAATMPALEAIGQAAMGTELLPGEDPALLTGPDRFEVCRVVGYVTEPAPAV